MTNCPNCGAPKTGPKCEYCDTVFSVISQGSPPHAELARLLSDKPNILDFMTPNEVRRLVGLDEINAKLKMTTMYENAINAMKVYGGFYD